MSSNILPIQPKEDQINDAIGNLKTEKQKASDSYSDILDYKYITFILY